MSLLYKCAGYAWVLVSTIRVNFILKPSNLILPSLPNEWNFEEDKEFCVGESILARQSSRAGHQTRAHRSSRHCSLVLVKKRQVDRVLQIICNLCSSMETICTYSLTLCLAMQVKETRLCTEAKASANDGFAKQSSCNALICTPTCHTWPGERIVTRDVPSRGGTHVNKAP
jgi:hypothetical protein